MTIKSKGKLPDEFLPAGLFLDDVQQIVDVLKALLAKDNQSKLMELSFSTSDQECDEVAELSRLLKKNQRLTIRLRNDQADSITLVLDPWHGAYWFALAFPRESYLGAHYKLEEIFKKRKLWWNSLFHSLPWWVFAALGLPFSIFSGIKIATTPLNVFLVVASIAAYIALIVKGVRHRPVILRYSWDPSPALSYLKDKIVPIIVSAFLGVLGTLLGIYIKHKFWP